MAAVVVDALALPVVELDGLHVKGVVRLQSPVFAVDDNLHALIGGVGGQGVTHHRALGVLDAHRNAVLDVNHIGEQAAVPQIPVHVLAVLV